MATLISCATGNLTAAATWAVSDATSILDSEAANTALTTSYVESAAFTPGAITIDGIAVKLASIAASPTGTISVRLAAAGVLVAGTEVTLNVSDLPSCATATNEGGWILFKFAAPVLLVVATAYTVSAKTSSATQVNLYRNATAGNWSRQLRTTTTQAPVAGDTMHAMGEHTGAGTGNDIAVTMDQTAATDYGSGTDGVVVLTINKRCSVSYGTTAATNYYLKLSGDLIVYNGGTFNRGTVGTPIPITSTAVLEFDPVASGGMGLILRNGATYTSVGVERTSGKVVIACQLTANAAANATSLTVGTDTGWLDNDVIIVSKTTRDGSERTERGTLNGAAGATTLTVDGFAGTGGGLLVAHTGTAPVQADVALLTRNVIFRSATSTLATYISIAATATVYMRWTEHRYIGKNTGGKRGIEIATTTGTCDIQYCSIYDTIDGAMYITSASGSGIIFSNNVFDKINTGLLIDAVSIAATTGVNTISGNYFFRGASFNNGTAVVKLGDIGTTFTNNVIGDFVQSGLVMSESSSFGTNSGNRVYGSRTSNAFPVILGSIAAGTTYSGGTIGSITSYLNNSEGIITTAIFNGVTIQNLVSYGNTNTNFCFGNAGITTSTTFSNTTITNLTCGSISGFSTTNGISTAACVFVNTTLSNSTIGVVAGVYTAHTNDFTAGAFVGDLLVDNCTFGSATLVTNNSSISTSGQLLFRKYQATDNNHRWYTRYGLAQSTGAGLTDTTVRTAGSLGLRMTPIDSTTGFSWSYKILAKAGTAVYANGFLQKNDAFATDVVTVQLFLPGSTVADSTYTMSNVTGAWESFIVNASYTGTIDLYATVVITAKTTTASAFLYVDDLYNGTNKITALDVWDTGKPSSIMFEQLGDAAAVWAVATAGLTAAGTTGAKLNSLLTLPQFIALK